jgi:hypothetical protein
MIGSSNVYRTYKQNIFQEYKRYKMICCTKLEVFKVAMAVIEGRQGKVIIAVIENLLCDAIKITRNP